MRPQLASIISLLVSELCVISSVFGICPEQCVCGRRRTDCSDSGLKSIPIFLDPRIHQLHLSNNGIISVQSSLQFYPNLRLLELSNNSLETPSAGQFSALKKLRLLKLDVNNIQVLLHGLLQGLQHLQELDLRSNGLEAISPQVFFEVPFLDRLNLADNRLQHLHAHVFRGLGNIRFLNLSRNVLKEDVFKSLEHLKTLKNVDLSGNKISRLSSDVISELFSLRNLSLADNRIQIIHKHTFSSLNSLERLNLRDNRISVIPSTLPHSLIWLDMGGNDLNYLNSKDSSSLVNLHELNLCNSNITCIGSNFFSQAKLLRILHLCKNRELKWISTRVFDGLNLTLLDISGNGLGTLDNITSIMIHSPDAMLNINNNSLQCNCSLLWLWQVLHNSVHYFEVSEVRCAQNGMLLQHLHEEQLQCQPWLLPLALVATFAVLIASAIFIVALISRYKHRKLKESADDHEVFQSSHETTNTMMGMSGSFTDIYKQVHSQPMPDFLQDSQNSFPLQHDDVEFEREFGRCTRPLVVYIDHLNQHNQWVKVPVALV